ncbi:MAG: ATP-binding cassette domain-containing protein [Candidatus Krumholzibacteriota bacterium]|nr:ATP-binding cassette domain-containing protein [Candidatus Krumholzibacteriota bacterium]
MIEVENLTRYYGANVGVRDLSFTVKRGEVLGFLGPNGAGKTTTMRMLTCFLPPTSGTARICGFDILEQSMEVRRRIGYLPEKTPLYHDMRTAEYLGFAAGLKGVPARRVTAAVGDAVEKCGLAEVAHRTIGHLSKGYQQRVGIAQAIIGDPELLILDEPTIGLDPKQIIDIRRLVKHIGQDRTVILSSHILPEVNQVCDRVIIVNRGELVAVDSPANLRNRLRRSSTVRVRLADPASTAAAAGEIKRMEGILAVATSPDDTNGIRVETAPEIDLRGAIASRLVHAGLPLVEIFGEELSLEEIFLRLVTEEA